MVKSESDCSLRTARHAFRDHSTRLCLAWLSLMHTLIIGQAGMGKTDLLFEHILDATASGGLFFLDPVGHDILRFLPRARWSDVIVFDPTDWKFPVAWNPLQIDAHPSLIASSVENAIKDSVGYSATPSPLMGQYIRACVYTLVQAGEPFIGFPYLLTSQRYRDRVVPKVTDQYLADFWRAFEGLPDKDKKFETGSAYNKAFSMFLDPRIRHVLGQKKSAWRMSDLTDKILVARLPVTQLGREQVQTVGQLLLAQLYLTAPHCPIFIDDAHLFYGATMQAMLATNRPVTISTNAVDREVLDYMSRKFIFRVSMKNADILNEHLGPDNLRIPLFKLQTYYARLFDGGISDIDIEPFGREHDGEAESFIRHTSRRNYSRPLTKVQKFFDRFIEDI